MKGVIVGCLVPTALVLSGCYHYVAVPPDASPVGQEVRIRVNRAEARRLEDALGRLDRPSLQGRVLQASDGSGLLLSYRLPGIEGASQRFNPAIAVRRDGIESLEVRTPSWLRTGLLAGGLAIVVVAILETELLTSNSGNPPDPEAFAPTLLRLRF